MNWMLNLTKDAKKDLQFFRKHDRKLYTKCFDILQAALDNPEIGIGKPEKLKYEKENLYSRRVSREHRAVYIVDFSQKTITFLAFRKHYS